MTSAELKEALMTEEPVVCNGIEYRCVSAIIYRKHGGGFMVRAELLDKNKNSVTIAEPHKVERKGV